MKRAFLYSILALLLAWPAFSQPMAQRLAAVPDDRYASYDKVTVFDSTYVMMEESGLSHVYNHQLWKILSDDGGRDFSIVKMDYDPLSAYVEIRKVVIYRKNGQQEVVDAPVFDYPAPAYMIYWGARQKMVCLGRLEVGDAVEVQTYKKGFTYALLQGDDPDAKYIPPMRGHFYDIVPFWSEQPVMEKTYQVNVLTDKKLRYTVYHGTLQETQEIADGARTLYTFTKKDIIPIRTPRYTLANNDIQTKLLLSTAQDWESKSRWFYSVNEDYGSFVPTEEVKEKVAELLKKAKSENDSISILTHWVADNMRYSGISMGEGEGFTLHKCEMNYTDRCGVCKDKAGMLISMLRAAGFEAYAAMTMAGERIDDIPADQFNHSVCVVQRRNGDYQLLDPTWVPNVRELWSSAEQQQSYLMGLPDGADLMETPISAPENHYIKIDAVTTIDKKGVLTGTLTISAEGQSDAAVRRVFARKADWDAALETELLAICPQAVIHSVLHTNPDQYLKQPVRIVYEIEIPDYAVVSKSEAMFVPLCMRNLFSRAMTHLRFDTSKKSRKYPFADACSRMVECHETVTLPYRYGKIDYNQPAMLSNATGAYSFQSSLDGTTLEVSETVKLNKRKYEAAEWPTFRQIVENQRQAATLPVYLSK